MTSTPSGIPKQSSHGPGMAVDPAAGGQVVLAALLLPGGGEVDLHVAAGSEVPLEPRVPADLRREGVAVRLTPTWSSVSESSVSSNDLGDPARVRPGVGEVVRERRPRSRSRGRCARRASRPVPWMACGGELSGQLVDGARRCRKRPSPVRPHHGTIGKQPNRSPCRSSSAPPIRRLLIRQPLPGCTVNSASPAVSRTFFSLLLTRRPYWRRYLRRRSARPTTTAEASARAAAGADPAQGGAARRSASGAGTGAYRPRGGAWSTSSALRPIMVRRACAASAGGSSGTVNSHVRDGVERRRRDGRVEDRTGTGQRPGGVVLGGPVLGGLGRPRRLGTPRTVVSSAVSAASSIARSTASSTARSRPPRPVRRTRPPVRRQPVRGTPASPSPAAPRSGPAAGGPPRASPRGRSSATRPSPPAVPVKASVVPPSVSVSADRQGELRRAAAARLGALALDGDTGPVRARSTSARRGR